MGGRQCDNWISSYLEYSKNMPSPELFRRWSAAGMIASATEMKTFMVMNRLVLYPNMFLLMVGPPGTGKTVAAKPLKSVFAKEMHELKLAASDVSSQSLIDEIVDARRTVLGPDGAINIFNAITVIADELGIFLKQYEGVFMSRLNSLFDGEPITERKRGNAIKISIEKPLLNMIAGTTPGWLGGNIPPTAWTEGFASRLVLIYAGKAPRINPFMQTFNDDILEQKLVLDLKRIHELQGSFSFDEDVVTAYLAWLECDLAPVPEHPKLEYYNARRGIHFWKLCMVQSLARSDELVIRMCDYQAAQDMLLEAEVFMPDIFKSMSMNANVIDEIFLFVYNASIKEKKPVLGSRILHFIQSRVPIHEVQKTLEIMVQSNVLKKKVDNGSWSSSFYEPVARSEHGQ